MKGFAIFIALVVVLVILGFIGIGRIADMASDRLSTKLGVAVSIDKLQMRPSRIDVDNLQIGNPPGYTLPKAFSAKELDVVAPVSRYFSKEIVIEEVHVKDIYLGLEFDTIRSASGNWTVIMGHFKQANQDTSQKHSSILIKRLIFTNVQPQLLFRKDGSQGVRDLSPIDRMEFYNVTSEAGIPQDQLMATVLAQMLKAIFERENLNNMLDSVWKTPGKAVDTMIKPFEKIFQALPQSEDAQEKFG